MTTPTDRPTAAKLRELIAAARALADAELAAEREAIAKQFAEDEKVHHTEAFGYNQDGRMQAGAMAEGMAVAYHHAARECRSRTSPSPLLAERASAAERELSDARALVANALGMIGEELGPMLVKLIAVCDEALTDLSLAQKYHALAVQQRDRNQLEMNEARAQLAATQIERDEWADAIRTVALGCIASPVAARAAIEDMKEAWDVARTQLAETKREIDALKDELSGEKAYGQALNEGTSRANYRILELERETESLRANRDALASASVQMSREIEELGARRDSLSTQVRNALGTAETAVAEALAKRDELHAKQLGEVMENLYADAREQVANARRAGAELALREAGYHEHKNEPGIWRESGDVWLFTGRKINLPALLARGV